jgi:hypothetical protein
MSAQLPEGVEKAIKAYAYAVGECQEPHETPLDECRPNVERTEAALRTAISTALDAVKAERDALAQYHGGHRPTCGGMDTAERTCECGYLDGQVYREIADERDAAVTDVINATDKAHAALNVVAKLLGERDAAVERASRASEALRRIDSGASGALEDANDDGPSGMRRTMESIQADARTALDAALSPGLAPATTTNPGDNDPTDDDRRGEDGSAIQCARG